MKRFIPFFAIIAYYCSSLLIIVPLFYAIGYKTTLTFLQYMVVVTPAHIALAFAGPRLFRVRVSAMTYKPSLPLLATGAGITLILFIVSVLLKNLTLSIINWDIDTPSPGLELTWKEIINQTSRILIAPFFEEFICRGIMLTYLVRHYNIFISLLITSVIFTIGHDDLLAVPDIFVFSMTLGYVFLKSGSLWTVMFIHSLGNLLANSSTFYNDMIVHLHVPIVPYALLLVVTIAALLLILKWFGKQKWQPEHSPLPITNLVEQKSEENNET